MKRFGILILLITVTAEIRAGSVASFTFVNPCQPFSAITAVHGKHRCYSFSASLPGPAPSSSTFLWEFGDGDTLYGTTAVHCYAPVNAPAVVTGTLTHFTPALCGASPVSSTFTLLLSPPDAGECRFPCSGIQASGRTVTLQPLVTIPEVSIEVEFGDGSGWQSWQNTHTYSVCGDYIVTRRVISMFLQDTCLEHCAVKLHCAPQATGISEAELTGITLVPNPASSVLRIRPGVYGQILVTDLSGRPVKQSHRTDECQTDVDISDLSPGIYYINIRDGSGAGKVLRFIRL